MSLPYKTALQQEEALRGYPPPKYRSDRQIINRRPMWASTVTLFNDLKFFSSGSYPRKVEAEQSAAKEAYECINMMCKYQPPTREGRSLIAQNTKEYFEDNRDIFTNVPKPRIYTNICVKSGPTVIRDTPITFKLCSALDAAQEEPERCTILICGNPKYPGNGWLRGSHNQEAQCWRRSGLHLYMGDSDIYQGNQKDSNYGLYNSVAQYCSSVPIIKNEEGAYTGLYFADFITCFPPNAYEAAKKFQKDAIEDCYYNRVCLFLSVCMKEAHDQTLILGAWGCGILKNDPISAAECFKRLLPIYNFKKVIFAIPDKTLLQAFENVFIQSRDFTHVDCDDCGVNELD